MNNEVGELQEKVQELQEAVIQLSQKLDFYRNKYEEYLQKEIQDRNKTITQLRHELAITVTDRYL